MNVFSLKSSFPKMSLVFFFSLSLFLSDLGGRLLRGRGKFRANENRPAPPRPLPPSLSPPFLRGHSKCDFYDPGQCHPPKCANVFSYRGTLQLHPRGRSPSPLSQPCHQLDTFLDALFVLVASRIFKDASFLTRLSMRILTSFFSLSPNPPPLPGDANEWRQTLELIGIPGGGGTGDGCMRIFPPAGIRGNKRMNLLRPKSKTKFSRGKERDLNEVRRNKKKSRPILDTRRRRLSETR